MIVEPLTVEHVADLQGRVQPLQAAAFQQATPSYFADLAKAGPAFAAIDGGRVVAIAGLSDMGGGRAMAWCFLAGDLRRVMVALVRTIRRYLDGCEYGRVELVTAPGFPGAADFARTLGFRFESQMHGWMPPRAKGEPRGAALMWTRGV